MAATQIAKQHANYLETKVGLGARQQYSQNQAKNTCFYFLKCPFHILATICVQCFAFYCMVCRLVKSGAYRRGLNIVMLLISILCSGILSGIHAHNAILQCFYSAGNEFTIRDTVQGSVSSVLSGEMN